VSQKRKLQRIKRSLATASSLVMRSVQVQGPSRAVVATENPIPRWDEQSQQVVSEVLLMDGIVLRGGRDWIPIVDSHNDRTVRNIFGSIRGLTVDAASGELYGEPVFASDLESQTIATRINEGHITDFSITAQPLETLSVKRGESYTTTRGVVIPGPALIHTQWQPLNASICATGADEDSTVRRSYTDLNRKVSRMDQALLSKLKEMNIPEGLTDPTAILAWVVGSKQSEHSDEGEVASAPVENAMSEEVKPEEKPVAPVENMDAEKKPEEAVARQLVKEEVTRALKSDIERRKEIQAACTLAKVERAFADELCDKLVPLDEARKRIIERMANQPLGSSVGADVRFNESEDDKFAEAVSNGIIQRMNNKAAKRLPAGQKSEFASRPLDEIAKDCLVRAGAKVERMGRKDIVLAAMGNPRVIRQHNIVMRSAMHTTGSFQNLLLDAINKSLLAEYEEAPYTWNLWARQAASVPDMKQIHRTRISEFPNLEIVPESSPYPSRQITDSKESYFIEKHGAEFSVSWETVINDDLDSLSRMTSKMGTGARRTQNAKVYEVLTANALMSDGVNLFGAHGSGSNTSGAAAAPSVTTLNAAFLAMRRQTGLNAQAILNIVPRYLIVPVSYEATAMEVLGSFARPEVGGSAAGNSNTLNIYGPGGQRNNLTLVADPVLDASSTTVWYLAADPSQVDTVEITFLQGEESPVIDTEEDFDRDIYKYKVRQTFGVKAIDWRGLFRNAA